MEKFTLIDSSIGIVGKRNSGKSYLLKHLLLYEAHLFSKIIVCSSTEAVNHFYSDLIPKNCIYDSYTEEFGEKLIAGLTRENSSIPKSEQKKVLLILDDLVGSINFQHSKTITKIFSMGRHISLGVCIVTQYLNAISPVIRNNLDFLMVGQQNHSSVDLLQQQFQSGNITKAEFMQMYYRCTIDYQFLVVNCNTVKDDNLNSLYGTIKCPTDEMNMILKKITLPREPKEITKQPNLWDCIFTEDVKEDKEDTIPTPTKIKQQIVCKKPNIQKAFK